MESGEQSTGSLFERGLSINVCEAYGDIQNDDNKMMYIDMVLEQGTIEMFKDLLQKTKIGLCKHKTGLAKDIRENQGELYMKRKKFERSTSGREQTDQGQQDGGPTCPSSYYWFVITLLIYRQNLCLRFRECIPCCNRN